MRNTRCRLVKEIERKIGKSNLNKTLRRYRDSGNQCRASEWCGRLSIVAHAADSVRGKDRRTNAYLRFRVGGRNHGKWKRTETVKNATLSPDFADEKIDFDINDGNAICEDGDTTLEVQLYDDNFCFDSLLGKTTIKIKKYISQALKPHTAFHQLYTYKFGEGYIKGASVKLTISFQHAFEGIAVFTLVDGRNLADRGGALDKQGEKDADDAWSLCTLFSIQSLSISDKLRLLFFLFFRHLYLNRRRRLCRSLCCH